MKRPLRLEPQCSRSGFSPRWPFEFRAALPRLPKPRRRHPCGGPKRPRERAVVIEPTRVRDLGHGLIGLGEEA